MSNSSTSPTLSIKVPEHMSVYMEAPTVLNNVSPKRVPASNCVKAMPKMYKRTSKRHNVKKTERVAVAMPFINIINSGMAFKRRAIRAMRDNLASLAMRNTEAFPSPPWPLPPVTSTTVVKTQVSITMKKTNNESNMNQPSRKQYLFNLKDMKRASHSNEK
mmetsp:Transcript_25569/g.51211  ORF Transcript_25569/g.51211 Transcript_25569/m.51211 type:complete len:161 (+) Transcript_25569:1300-1782(+)